MVHVWLTIAVTLQMLHGRSWCLALLVLVWNLCARLVPNGVGNGWKLNSRARIGRRAGLGVGFGNSGSTTGTSNLLLLALLFLLLLASFPLFANFFEFCEHQDVSLPMFHGRSLIHASGQGYRQSMSDLVQRLLYSPVNGTSPPSDYPCEDNAKTFQGTCRNLK